MSRPHSPRRRRSPGKRTIRRQRPIPGGRDPLFSCVMPVIRDAVQAEADRYGVTRSFVTAVRMAESFGIDIEHYIAKKRDR